MQSAWAGPLDPEVLQFPRTASSGRRGIRSTRGFRYGFRAAGASPGRGPAASLWLHTTFPFYSVVRSAPTARALPIPTRQKNSGALSGSPVSRSFTAGQVPHRDEA